MQRHQILKLIQGIWKSQPKRCCHAYSTDTVQNEVPSPSKQIKDFMMKYKTSELPIAYQVAPPKKETKKGNCTDTFVMDTIVETHGGTGGDGQIVMDHVKNKHFAGPVGGNGGNGGHVLFHAVEHINSLTHVKNVVKAEMGAARWRYMEDGKNSADVYIEVPIGTCIQFEGEEDVVLNEDGMVYLAARGGAGGKGNLFFKSSTNQAPDIAEAGAEGEVRKYRITMKTMAHVGLVGFPNAGKSSLLRAISRARPLISQVAFSTLTPKVGTIKYKDFGIVRVADIPGLVENAHKDEGLGIEFLMHVAKCNALLYVVDLSEQNPLEKLSILKKELEHFEEGLSERPSAIIANKIDLPGSERVLEQLSHGSGMPVLPVSAKYKKNIQPLQAMLRFIAELSNCQSFPIRAE